MIVKSFGKDGREVVLTVGQDYVVDQVNPQAKKNRGRKCTYLGVKTLPDGYQKAKVRYLDNNRIGSVDFADLNYLLPSEE